MSLAFAAATSARTPGSRSAAASARSSFDRPSAPSRASLPPAVLAATARRPHLDLQLRLARGAAHQTAPITRLSRVIKRIVAAPAEDGVDLLAVAAGQLAARVGVVVHQAAPVHAAAAVADLDDVALVERRPRRPPRRSAAATPCRATSARNAPSLTTSAPRWRAPDGDVARCARGRRAATATACRRPRRPARARRRAARRRRRSAPRSLRPTRAAPPPACWPCRPCRPPSRRRRARGPRRRRPPARRCASPLGSTRGLAV